MHASQTTPAPNPEPLAIVCSLDAAGLADRLEEFTYLFSAALVSHEREPARLRLVLAIRQEAEAPVRELFSREAECCRFFSFDIHRDERLLIVTMDVPEGAEPLLDDFERLVVDAGRATSR